MGILYQASDPMIWAIWLFVVFALMAFNEFGRTSVWGGVALFVVAPIVFTISYAPHPCQDAGRPTPRPLPSEGGGAGLHLRARNSQSEQASR